MLSGDGNENGKKKKTSIGPNQQKSNFARAAHLFCTFLCLRFVRLQRGTSRNFLVTRFMEEMSMSLIFTPVAAAIVIFSPPLQNFMLFLQQKKVSFVFSLSLQLFFSFSFAGCRPTFSFFLSFSFSVFQICGHNN